MNDPDFRNTTSGARWAPSPGAAAPRGCLGRITSRRSAETGHDAQVPGPPTPSPLCPPAALPGWLRLSSELFLAHLQRAESPCETDRFFTQQVLTECPLCARPWACPGGHSSPCPRGAGLSAVTEPNQCLTTLRAARKEKEESSQT